MSCLEGAFRISQRRSCLSSPCLDIMCTHRLTAVKPLARSSKCCSSSLLMVCIGHVMCTQQKTDCMYEVLYMSRSYIVFARHLQGVYLNWPLTINVNMQFYMKNKSSNDIQSSPQVTCGEVVGEFFFFARLPAASPPACLFHAVSRRQRKLLTFR